MLFFCHPWSVPVPCHAQIHCAHQLLIFTYSHQSLPWANAAAVVTGCFYNPKFLNHILRKYNIFICLCYIYTNVNLYTIMHAGIQIWEVDNRCPSWTHTTLFFEQCVTEPGTHGLAGIFGLWTLVIFLYPSFSPRTCVFWGFCLCACWGSKFMVVWQTLSWWRHFNSPNYIFWS